MDKLKAFVISASVSLVIKKKKTTTTTVFPTKKTKPTAHSRVQFVLVFALALAPTVQTSTTVAGACKMGLPLTYKAGASLPFLTTWPGLFTTG